MIRKYIFTLSLLILISCSKSDKKFYENGRLKEIHFYNKKEKDSSVFYFDSDNSPVKNIIKKDKDSLFYIYSYSIGGEKISEGFMKNDSLRLGTWYYYKGDTTKIFEYKNIGGKEYLNQSWIRNSEGDTISGNYFLLKEIKDTVTTNELVSLRFYLEGFLFSKNSELLFILPNGDENFTATFTNENRIKKDTIKSLKYDKANQHLKNLLPLNHIVIVNIEFETPGEKNIQGILKEVQKKNYMDSVVRLERNIYFNKKIFVR